ncbi:MAG TPA: AmmeMemoRadiSam system protein B [Geobacteraceae bacterium]
MRFWKLVVVLLIPLALGVVVAAGRGPVKEPAVAGAFYPAGKRELQEAIDRCLAAARTVPVEGRLLGLIAPHAGYEFSGGVAGVAHARLKGSGITTVILIGPSHHAPLRGAAVFTRGAMRTPLGTVRINERVASSLVSAEAGISADPAPFAREHSLEVQLPFLQRTLEKFTIVPILIGIPNRESFAVLSEKLATILRDDEHAIILASTDLSHYHDSTTAKRMDDSVIDKVERLAIGDLENSLMGGEGEMCGGYPVLITLTTVKKAGATNGVLYAYAHSGMANGDNRRVVGYAALGLYRSPLGQEQKEELLALAKSTLEAHVAGRKLPQGSKSARLTADGASFVTLKDKRGNLRGCIGTIQPVMPLDRSVITNAVSAASRDPRFPPVAAGELPELSVEVTVLSALEPLKDTAQIAIGKHGLYLEKEGMSSVFLPQVPVEFGWNTATYLEELARKAGLPKDGWRGGKLYTFTADIINERL